MFSPDLLFDFDRSNLSVETKIALEELSHHKPPQHGWEQVAIFTDGSGEKSFGFVIIASDEREIQSSGGAFAYAVQEANDALMAGADQHDVPQIETAAVLAALSWVWQSSLSEGTEVAIAPDSTYSLGAIEEQFHTKKTTCRYALPLR